MEAMIDQVENNFSQQEVGENVIEELDAFNNVNNKLSSGRKPLPIKYYVHTRKAKIK